MRVRVRHTYDFGSAREAIGPDLVRPESWDAARATDGPFGLPDSREAWERAAAAAGLRARAASIVQLVSELHGSALASYGVGTAGLELNIQRLAPELRLVCTDYAPRTVERLRALFPEAEVLRHDLRRDEPVAADVPLMHRLDAELSDEAWHEVFARFEAPVIFVPNAVVGPVAALRELARRIRGRDLTHAGWDRNDAALRWLWSPSPRDEPIGVGGASAHPLRHR